MTPNPAWQNAPYEVASLSNSNNSPGRADEVLMWDALSEAPAEILESEDDVAIAYTCMVTGLRDTDYMRSTLYYVREWKALMVYAPPPNDP